MFTVDFVRNEGRDLGTRAAINARPINTPSTAPRQLAFLGPAAERHRHPRRDQRRRERVQRPDHGPQAPHDARASTSRSTYTLADSKSNIGTAADELNQNNIQDVALLYDDPRTWGPTGRTDARHSGTIAAVCSSEGR